ncbi:hypothetical protein BRYFOR_07758 [Marvinbryantia formatexigens DSM 14469]|uniref:Uncharacterized protein n=1 Tax=Marvinbryantia formatexigens DSM 14469 TaxID=478749 RepID=C6LGJ8_9FIRM|nr:hypothetical protein [Marvinbryantia formatexigens]EET60198.1 hypothetical protein BRYFOR_07758 [Marvinbryantia formatexigens DSM 14469]UWO24224.1 hypothetical protein NQ534_17640 [Marvinbryantia formatexigens DSM 14469]
MLAKSAKAAYRLRDSYSGSRGLCSACTAEQDGAVHMLDAAGKRMK